MRYSTVLLLLFCFLLTMDSIAQESPQFPADADYYVEAEVSNATPYVGEEITYIFRYYAFNLSTGIYDDLPDFEGFWLSDVSELITPRVATINNRQYSVMEVYVTVTPLRSGQIVIAPSILNVPETLFEDAASLETTSLQVNVQPVPSGAPDSFLGAVGQFDMTVSVSELSTTIGQPINLRVTINGSGSLERIPAPRLPVFEGWRTYQSGVDLQSSDLGGLSLGEKTFEWLLIPDVAGTQTLTPVEFTYFNPQFQNFVTLSGDAFAIEVFPSASGERRSTRLGDEKSDVLAIFPVSSTLNTNSRHVSPLFWLLWIVTPLLSFGIGAYRVLSGYTDERNRSRRQAKAFERFSYALNRSKSLSMEEFSRQVEVLLIRFVENKSGEKVMTSSDAQTILRKNITGEGVELFVMHLNEAQGFRYLPDADNNVKQSFIDRVVDTIRKIDRSWRTV